MKKVWYSLLIISLILGNAAVLYASDKSGKTIIYVKNFLIEDGLKANDPIKSQVKELIQEEFEKDGRYVITADEDISAIVKQEEKAQSYGKCSSESCIQDLMEKINAQIVIYGRIRKADGFTYITVRYMDRSTGVPRVSKIRTIKYHYGEFLEKGVRALSNYLITGDDDKVAAFMDEVYTREENDLHGKNREEERKLANLKKDDFKKKVEQAAKEREKGLTSRFPVLRFGYGFYMSAANKDINDSFTEQNGFLMDWVFGRDSIMDGRLNRDFFMRFGWKTYETSDSSVKNNGIAGKDVINSSNANLYTWDFGFRVKARKYIMMTAFDPYVLASFRSGYYREKAKDKAAGRDLQLSLIGYGGYVGGGLEFAFFENLGFFAEYNRGIFKLGDKKMNFEGNQIYGGVTLRTQY